MKKEKELIQRWADALKKHSFRPAVLTKARAYLAQPRPEGKVLAPIPLSERPQVEKDCDAEGRCWVWNPEMYWWELCPLRLITINAGDPYDYWLPHWAIPTPQEQP